MGFWIGASVGFLVALVLMSVRRAVINYRTNKMLDQIHCSIDEMRNMLKTPGEKEVKP